MKACIIASVILSMTLPVACTAGAAEKRQTSMELSQMPKGYNLQSFDDCGVPGRQPHAPSQTSHTFSAERVNANEKARTVTYGAPHFDMAFDNLDSGVPYVLAVTYASERGNRRVQSLSAGAAPLHGPRVLPDGTSQRLLFKLPSEAIQNGHLVLHFICNEGPNAVVSVVELWAPLPSPTAFHLDLTPNIHGKLTGSVLDLAYDGVAGAEVIVREAASGEVRATTTTQAEGLFEVDVSSWVKPGATGIIEVVARSHGIEAKTTAPFSDFYFLSPRFKPLPKRVSGAHTAVIKLDGKWRIHPSPPEDFRTKPSDGQGWSSFIVPGQWLQLEPSSVRKSRDLGARGRVVGIATDFDIPKSWAGKRLFLRFDAVHGGADYWLNGHPLGYSENLFTPVEFDVTQAARPGEKNHLAMAMKVQTPSEAASFSSDYAFHNLGGIDRSVWLFALPPMHIAGIRHETLLDSACKDATLSVNLTIENSSSAPVSGLTLRVSLQGPDGKRVALSEDRVRLDTIQPGDTRIVKQYPVANPLKWSAEKPRLYHLTVGLYCRNILLERVEENVGFRKIELRDHQLWINGKRVKLAGVNRHEVDPLTGRAATAVHAEEDARLLKEANFNYIRTSHYPPTREFLDACDRIGLYVECEAPFCWVRGRGEDDPRWIKQFLTPAAAMLEYHGDHPSVIFWSLGNESGSGPGGENQLPANFAAMLDLCRRQDPSRPVVFNNEWSRDGGACDIAVLHYPPFPPEECSFVKDDPRPILLDEYFPPQTFTFAEELNLNPGLDVVNWSTGQNSPHSYWSQMYASNRVIGGAIWAGIDEEFYFPDGQVKGYGPWGFVDVWRRRKSLWWDAKRIHSPVWIPVRQLNYTPGQRVVRVPVENRYSFTDLSELQVWWELLSKKGRCRVSLPPQSQGEIEAPIPQGTPEGALLIFRFMDAKGKLVTAHGITLGRVHVPLPANLKAGCPEWQDEGQVITINGRNFHLKIERSTGNIRQDRGDGSVPLLRFPTLFVTRREDRNVFNPGGLPYAQYPDEASRVIDAVTVEKRGEALAITVRDHYKSFAGYVEMLLDTAGQSAVSFQYQYAGETFNVSELGLRFLMDVKCQEIRWRRQTEWDVYPEDHIGRPEGRARARMGKEWGHVPFPPYHAHPHWPWHLDANQFGTRDFRATKYHVYEAHLLAPDGSGIRVGSNGATNVRSCLAANVEPCWVRGVQFHALLSSPPAQLASGDRLSGSFYIRMDRARKAEGQ